MAIYGPFLGPFKRHPGAAPGPFSLSSLLSTSVTECSEAKNERKSFRQGGLFKGRDWLDSGAIIASVASHVQLPQDD